MRTVLLLCALTACFSKPANQTGGGDRDGGVDSLVDSLADGPSIDPSAPSRISAGDRHACWIRDGRLLCWGMQDNGQLGERTDGVIGFTGNPGTASPLVGWTSVAAGQQHTCGVRDGKAYCWGENFNQQSVPSDLGRSDVPITPVMIPGNPTVDRIFAGPTVTCATTTTHEAYCWGRLDFVNQFPFPTAPVRLGGTTTFTEIAIAADHACALAETGIVHCWGISEQRQTGHAGAAGINDVTFANASPIDSTEQFTSIAADTEATCGTTVAGKLLCWGSVNQGQLATAPPSGSGYAIWTVDDTKVWTEVTVGPLFTCGVSGGDVYCWGDDLYGALGDGKFTKRRAPTLTTPVAVGMQVSQLTAGDGYACALSSDGEALRCWGNNGRGQLGNKKFSAKYDPARAKLPAGMPVQQLIAGSDHTCALVGPGPAFTPYCWGRNGDRQVGSTSAVAVQPVPVVASTRTFRELAAGEKHTCGVVSDGSMECWGSNDQSQLAAGMGEIRSTFAGPWTTVAAGSRMSCGIATGDLYCWGERPGQPPTATRTQYPRVGSWAWQSISIGSGFMIAVALAGSTPHILGHGTVTKECAAGLATDVAPPDPVKTWVEVFSGIPFNGIVPQISAAYVKPTPQPGVGAHACMHRGSATTSIVTCWGDPTISAVGDEGADDLVCRTHDMNTVDVGTGWRGVDVANPGLFAMADQTCALDAAHHIKCWGRNNNVELGTLQETPVPTEVNNMEWKAIAGGDEHTCGITLDGMNVYCWGENQYGQIGDDTSYEPSPVVSGVL